MAAQPRCFRARLRPNGPTLGHFLPQCTGGGPATVAAFGAAAAASGVGNGSGITEIRVSFRLPLVPPLCCVFFDFVSTQSPSAQTARPAGVTRKSGPFLGELRMIDDCEQASCLCTSGRRPRQGLSTLLFPYTHVKPLARRPLCALSSGKKKKKKGWGGSAYTVIVVWGRLPRPL